MSDLEYEEEDGAVVEKDDEAAPTQDRRSKVLNRQFDGWSGRWVELSEQEQLDRPARYFDSVSTRHEDSEAINKVLRRQKRKPAKRIPKPEETRPCWGLEDVCSKEKLVAFLRGNGAKCII